MVSGLMSISSWYLDLSIAHRSVATVKVVGK